VNDVIQLHVVNYGEWMGCQDVVNLLYNFRFLVQLVQFVVQ